MESVLLQKIAAPLIVGALVLSTAIIAVASEPASASKRVDDHDVTTEIDRVLASNPIHHAAQETTERLSAAGVLTQFPEVLGAVILDPEGRTLTIAYDGRADRSQVDEFLLRIEEVSVRSPLVIVALDTGYSAESRAEMARDVAANGVAWAERLGIRDVQAAEVDPLTGAITVYTSEESSDLVGRSFPPIGSVPVIVRGSAGALELGPARYKVVGETPDAGERALAARSAD
jgi:hypothetical protein